MVKIVFFILLLLVGCSSPKADFVSIHDIDPAINLDIRYYGDNNFIGKRINGYEAPKCMLTKEAVNALELVQKDLQTKGHSLKMYDRYRPQRAVNEFIEWAKDLSDIKMKKIFYPNVEKKNLFKDGYIASRSGHSRGSTMDLTIDGLDMGTPFDFFSPLSHTENPLAGEDALNNRMLLKDTMEKYGFVNYDKEWWHYTLKNEPFPKTYFDFVIK